MKCILLQLPHIASFPAEKPKLLFCTVFRNGAVMFFSRDMRTGAHHKENKDMNDNRRKESNPLFLHKSGQKTVICFCRNCSVPPMGVMDVLRRAAAGRKLP